MTVLDDYAMTTMIIAIHTSEIVYRYCWGVKITNRPCGSCRDISEPGFSVEALKKLTMQRLDGIAYTTTSTAKPDYIIVRKCCLIQRLLSRDEPSTTLLLQLTYENSLSNLVSAAPFKFRQVIITVTPKCS